MTVGYPRIVCSALPAMQDRGHLALQAFDVRYERDARPSDAGLRAGIAGFDIELIDAQRGSAYVGGPPSRRSSFTTTTQSATTRGYE